ncbi:MAG TPA: metal ABC transporter permease [Solirubrobacteraceae bacterium]|nr:metal ABC transporter permease [Solirubrobacteraceae bacterium]
MFAHEAVRNALIAGTPIALASGLIGWFVVVRSEVFAGDALSHVAFTGAVAAAAIAIDLRVGLFAACIGAALLIALAGVRGRADDVAIGIVLTGILGLGVLSLHLLASGGLGGNGTIAAQTLFGSLYSLSRSQALLGAAIGAAIVIAAALLARPLLFASLQGEVARAQGLPVGLIGASFMALLGADVAEAAQAVGALLLLGLLAGPGGAAARLTARPFVGMALACTIALAALWGGVAISYGVPSIPPATAIIAIVALAHLGSLMA